MPWEETTEYVRSGHRDPEDFDKGSFRTIDIDPDKGIKAVVGCPKGHFKDGKCEAGMEVTSFLFSKKEGWSMRKAKEWFTENKDKHSKHSL
jgi:hypothetical protein